MQYCAVRMGLVACRDKPPHRLKLSGFLPAAWRRSKPSQATSTFGDRSGELVLPHQPAADDRLLDLRGALADEQKRRLAEQPLDLVLLGVAIAAVDAERLGGHLEAVL